jgi:hypothetical protein
VLLTARVDQLNAESRSGQRYRSWRSSIVVEFLLDGAPLAGSSDWRNASALVAPGVAAAITRLRRNGEATVLRISSARSGVARQIEQQSVHMRPEEALYLDYILTGEMEVFRFSAIGDADTRETQLLIAPDEGRLSDVVGLGWNWHSFGGWIAPPGVPVDRKLLGALGRGGERERELVVCRFDDAADACALRLASSRLSVTDLVDRVDLDAINSALINVG